MPKSRKKAKKKSATGTSRKVVRKTIRRAPKPVLETIEEKRVLVTEPEVEIRRPATLAAAFTEPTVAVVKPRTRVKSVERKRKIA